MIKGYRVYFFRRDPKSIYHKDWECSAFVPVDNKEEAITAAYKKTMGEYPEKTYSATCKPVTVATISKEVFLL